MKRSIEKIIRLRNPDFFLDTRVGARIILAFALKQCLMLLRGTRLLFYLRNPKGALLGSGVRLYYISRIRLGRLVKLDTGVYISALGYEGICLGDHVGIGAFSRVVVSTSLQHIGKGIRIGNNVGIGEFSYLGGGGGLDIGNDTIIGQYFSCHPENHLFDSRTVLIRHQGVSRTGIVVGKNCWIGSKVTILDGVTLGDGCVVAAGAVVTKSFPDGSIIAGVPAKQIGTRYE